MFGLDDPITKEEVKTLMADIGKCDTEVIKIGEIKAMRNGLGMVWAQCPLTQAIQLAYLKTIRIGWSRIQIELLKARPAQCFRCWQLGHLKHMCKAKIERSNLCYKCGAAGHQVKWCNKEAYCIICKEEGHEPKHRVGSAICISNRNGSRTQTDQRKDKKGEGNGQISKIRNVNERMEIVNNDDDWKVNEG